MATSDLLCGTAANLFYEPGGLLLRCCLVPSSADHETHLLTFQLGYLGAGEITVDIALEGGAAGGHPHACEPNIVTTRLCGTAESDDPDCGSRRYNPSVNLMYTTVPSTPVHFRYTVWGQPAARGDSLRGQLSTTVSGSVPALVATTRSGATRSTLPTVRRLPKWSGCTVGKAPSTR